MEMDQAPPSFGFFENGALRSRTLDQVQTWSPQHGPYLDAKEIESQRNNTSTPKHPYAYYRDANPQDSVDITGDTNTALIGDWTIENKYDLVDVEPGPVTDILDGVPVPLDIDMGLPTKSSRDPSSETEKTSLHTDLLSFLRNYKALRQKSHMPSLDETFPSRDTIDVSDRGSYVDDETSVLESYIGQDYDYTENDYSSSLEPIVEAKGSMFWFVDRDQSEPPSTVMSSSDLDNVIDAICEAGTIIGEIAGLPRPQPDPPIPLDRRCPRESSTKEADQKRSSGIQRWLSTIGKQWSSLAHPKRPPEQSTGFHQARPSQLKDPTFDKYKQKPPEEATKGEERTVAMLLRTVEETLNKLKVRSRTGSQALQDFVIGLGATDRILKIGSDSLMKILSGGMVVTLEEIYCYLHVAYAMYRAEKLDTAEKTVASQFRKDLKVFERVLSSQSSPGIVTGPLPESVLIFREIMDIMWEEMEGAIIWIKKTCPDADLEELGSRPNASFSYDLENSIPQIRREKEPPDLAGQRRNMHINNFQDSRISNTMSSIDYLEQGSRVTIWSQRRWEPGPLIDKAFNRPNSVPRQPSLSDNPTPWWHPDNPPRELVHWDPTLPYNGHGDPGSHCIIPPQHLQQPAPTPRDLLCCNITQRALEYLHRLSFMEMFVLFMAGLISSLFVWSKIPDLRPDAADCDLCGEPKGAFRCFTCEQAVSSAQVWHFVAFENFRRVVSKFTPLTKGAFNSRTGRSDITNHPLIRAKPSEGIIGEGISPDEGAEAPQHEKSQPCELPCSDASASADIEARVVSIAQEQAVTTGVSVKGSRKRKRASVEPSPEVNDEDIEGESEAFEVLSIGVRKLPPTSASASDTPSSAMSGVSSSSANSFKRTRHYRPNRKTRDCDIGKPKIPCGIGGCQAQYSSTDALRRHRKKHDPLTHPTVFATCLVPGCEAVRSGIRTVAWSNMNTHQKTHHPQWIQDKSEEERCRFT
ncbi:hypothetical protein TWF281_004785 [Arthrobotrys megalospora]